MAEPLSIVATVIGAVATGLAIVRWAVERPPPTTADRNASPPPAPQPMPSQPQIGFVSLDAFDALKERVVKLENAKEEEAREAKRLLNTIREAREAKLASRGSSG